MPAPSAEPAILSADEVKVGSCRQDVEPQTQKCTKAFQKSSAQAILQEDRIKFLTTINNEAKVRRSTKSLVLGKARVMSYKDLVEARAKRVEKESAQEAKGKRRRGRKPKSSPPDLPEAEEGTAGTARRGRKRKSRTPEPEADKGTVDTPRRTRKRKSPAQDAPKPSSIVVPAQVVPEPWRALVAQMF
jgi:hypothetical protein